MKKLLIRSARLLDLSYLWTGSLNGIQLQIWGTWLFYAVLVDLGDAVADELSLPFNRISLEMIYRGLNHFSVARQKGLATEPVKYFAERRKPRFRHRQTTAKTQRQADHRSFS